MTDSGGSNTELPFIRDDKLYLTLPRQTVEGLTTLLLRGAQPVSIEEEQSIVQERLERWEWPRFKLGGLSADVWVRSADVVGIISLRQEVRRDVA